MNHAFTSIPNLGDANVKSSAYHFRLVAGLSGKLTDHAMGQADVFRMIRRRVAAAGIRTLIVRHRFRATGITEYLRNGGELDEVERIVL